MRVLVIGGVAAGPKIAAKVRRERSDAEVTLLERGAHVSYAGCGLPYFLEGEFTDAAEVMKTPAGALRDVGFFRKVKGVDVRTQTEALAIDRSGKRVRARGPQGEEWLPYDKLALAVGASPVVPPFARGDRENVRVLHRFEDALRIHEAVQAGAAAKVVVVGGGYIGVEAAEALAVRGCQVTVVELQEQILGLVDWEMARLVQSHLEAKGVRVLTATKVTGLVAGGDGRRATAVETSGGVLPADLVLVAIGVRPNVELATAAGLELGPTGALKVDARMRTSDPDIFAAGDCVECLDRVTGRPCYVPLGSTANKQGRVAALNIAGQDCLFPGIVGSGVCRVFDFTVARTGLSERQAREAGFDAVAVLCPAPDRPHFMKKSAPVLLKLVADRRSGRLLGAQAVGPGDGEKRVSVAATAITAGLRVDEVSGLDLCYAPPYGTAMDNLVTAADVLGNKLSGRLRSQSPIEVKRRLDAGERLFLLDVRSPAEHEQVRLEGATLVPLGQLEERLAELPRDRPIVTFCKVSLRGYEAALKLARHGFADVTVLEGGVAMWPYAKSAGRSA